jgi:hypothetical protein
MSIPTALDREYRGITIRSMPVRKIAISLSSDALAMVDRDAAQEGMSRSAWFERAAQQAKRREAVGRALRQAHRNGVRAATQRELDALRQELSRAG